MNSLYKRIVTIGMICFTAVLAWIYCALEYRTEPIYIIGVSLILVISLYALLNAYAGLCIERENKLHNYIDRSVATVAAKLEHGQDNTDLERLSKAIYVQLRKSNTLHMQMMETGNRQSAQNREDYSLLNEEMNKLIADSINKAVKIIVKYSQNNHDGIVSAMSNLSTGLDRVGSEINQIKSEITNLKIDLPSTQVTEPVSSADTAEVIVNNRQAATETADSDDELRIHESSETMSQDLIDSFLTGNAENESNADVIPFPAKEAAEENDDPNRRLTPDEIAALFASSADTSADTNNTDTDAQVPPVSDDSNRQLTPEEIAALFSSVH